VNAGAHRRDYRFAWIRPSQLTLAFADPTQRRHQRPGARTRHATVGRPSRTHHRRGRWPTRALSSTNSGARSRRSSASAATAVRRWRTAGGAAGDLTPFRTAARARGPRICFPRAFPHPAIGKGIGAGTAGQNDSYRADLWHRRAAEM